MIDTGHLGVPPDNNGKIFDAVPRRTHSLTLTSKALREVEVDLAHVESITTIGRLAASVAPVVTQSIASIVTMLKPLDTFWIIDPRPWTRYDKRSIAS